MEWCVGGQHVIAPATEGVLRREDRVFCRSHIPPEPDETAPFRPTEREYRRIEFQRWRYQHGRLTEDVS